jgi:protein-tyrosine-phosphatase
MASSFGSKTKSSNLNKNPLEALHNLGNNIVGESASAVKDIGTGIFDQMLGLDSAAPRVEQSHSKQSEKPRRSGNREIRTIWSFQQEQETRTISELVKQLKQEVKLLKQADKALINEVKDIENLTLESLPAKPGIYHIRFMELLISILRTLRAKINESRTWLSAFQSKKKKRGSAFATMSKKKGTQFSLSQELSNARSVQ